jgi:hypothetical protein
MRKPHVKLGTLLLALMVGMAASAYLDHPSDAEATAAYRAIPAIAAASPGKQHQSVHIILCRPGKGRPGVTCRAKIKTAPKANASDATIQFARGPDSAWVATLGP